jgi:hypothetical protein
MKNFIRDLDQFVTNHTRNAWIEEDDFCIYFRGTVIKVIGQFRPFLTMANMYCDRRGLGRFTKLINHLQTEFDFKHLEGIYVENVQNIRLRMFMERKGFIPHPDIGDIPECHQLIWFKPEVTP